eukprot:g62889.t1
MVPLLAEPLQQQGRECFWPWACTSKETARLRFSLGSESWSATPSRDQQCTSAGRRYAQAPYPLVKFPHHMLSACYNLCFA